MVAFIVLLQCNKFIALREEWIESPILSTKSKVFYSANRESIADFSIKTKLFFHDDETCCYIAYICKRYNNELEAKEYLENRKPRVSRWLNQMYLKHPQVIEEIEISSDSSDDDASNPNKTEDSSANQGSDGMKPKNRELRIVLDQNEVVSYQKTYEESDQGKTPTVSSEGLPQSTQVSNEPFPNVCQDSTGNSIQVPEANIVQSSNQLNFTLRELVVILQYNQASEAQFVDDPVINMVEVPSGTSESEYRENGSEITPKTVDVDRAIKNASRAKITKINRKKNQQACSGSKSKTIMTRSKFQKFLVEDEANRKEARAEAIKFQNHGRNSLASILTGGFDDVDSRIREVVVKLEKENENLYAANFRLNQRVGLEEIFDSSSESSDDNEFKPAVNTRNYQMDGELAKSYYFITNNRGDRYYLNETLKLKLEVVETLKKMNSTYPKMDADYDVEYLYHAMRSIFKQKVLEDFFKSGSLRDLTSSYLKFLKVLFQERAGDDKKRVDTFREKAMSAAKRIHNTYFELI